MFRNGASVALEFVWELVLPPHAHPCYDKLFSPMKTALLIRFCVIGLIVAGIVYLAIKLPSMDVGSQFALTVIGGTILGILAVKYLVPRIGDAVGNFFYSPGEAAVSDESSEAAAKLAQGDYQGAIAAYQAILDETPDDTHSINEIAKIRMQHLGDPLGALTYLQEQLEGRDWVEDDAAFLMFRIAELHQEPLHDYAAAEEVLQQVIAEFPHSRHSSNAHHRIHEVQHAQYKARSQPRPKPGTHA